MKSTIEVEPGLIYTVNRGSVAGLSYAQLVAYEGDEPVQAAHLDGAEFPGIIEINDNDYLIEQLRERLQVV